MKAIVVFIRLKDVYFCRSIIARQNKPRLITWKGYATSGVADLIRQHQVARTTDGHPKIKFRRALPAR